MQRDGEKVTSLKNADNAATEGSVRDEYDSLKNPVSDGVGSGQSARVMAFLVGASLQLEREDQV